MHSFFRSSILFSLKVDGIAVTLTFAAIFGYRKNYFSSLLFVSAAVIPNMASDLENGNDSDRIKSISSVDDSNDALVTVGVSNEKSNMDQTTAMDVYSKNTDLGTKFSFLVT